MAPPPPPPPPPRSNCNTKFFDLNKKKILCPNCNTEIIIKKKISNVSNNFKIKEEVNTEVDDVEISEEVNFEDDLIDDVLENDTNLDNN